jgi:hypothetical protein
LFSMQQLAATDALYLLCTVVSAKLLTYCCNTATLRAALSGCTAGKRL